MIDPDSHHHEQALTLLQQLLLTGSCLLPTAAMIRSAVKSKIKKTKKNTK